MANLLVFYYVEMFLQELSNYLTFFESKIYEYIQTPFKKESQGLRKVISRIRKAPKLCVVTRGSSEMVESKSTLFG